MTSLTAQDVADFELIESEIEEDLPEFKKRGLRLGSNLRTVRDRELYKKDYKTFEAYLELRWDISRARAYQLIDWDKVVKSLPKSLSTVVDTERKARALTDAPPEQQAKAVESAIATGDPITSKILSNQLVINKNLSTTGGQTKTKPVILDALNWPIPECCIPVWNRAQEVQDLMTMVSRVKNALEKAASEDDPIYRIVPQAALDHLSRTYQFITDAKPYAVCVFCQGKNNRENCRPCRGTGLISKYGYEVRADKKLVALRELAIKKEQEENAAA